MSQQPDRRVFVREVPVGLAAHQAGLLPGDEILFIDGVSVLELDAKEIHSRLSGQRGEQVNLTLARGDSILRVALRRTPPTRWVPESQHSSAKIDGLE